MLQKAVEGEASSVAATAAGGSTADTVGGIEVGSGATGAVFRIIDVPCDQGWDASKVQIWTKVHVFSQKFGQLNACVKLSPMKKVERPEEDGQRDRLL